MDSSFLHRVTLVVTFCRNELLFDWLQSYLFFNEIYKFLEGNIL